VRILERFEVRIELMKYNGISVVLWLSSKFKNYAIIVSIETSIQIQNEFKD